MHVGATQTDGEIVNHLCRHCQVKGVSISISMAEGSARKGVFVVIVEVVLVVVLVTVMVVVTVVVEVVVGSANCTDPWTTSPDGTPIHMLFRPLAIPLIESTRAVTETLSLRTFTK